MYINLHVNVTQRLFNMTECHIVPVASFQSILPPALWFLWLMSLFKYTHTHTHTHWEIGEMSEIVYLGRCTVACPFYAFVNFPLFDFMYKFGIFKKGLGSVLPRKRRQTSVLFLLFRFYGDAPCLRQIMWTS